MHVSSVLLVLVAAHKCGGWQEMRLEIVVPNDGWDVMCQDQCRIVMRIFNSWKVFQMGNALISPACADGSSPQVRLLGLRVTMHGQIMTSTMYVVMLNSTECLTATTIDFDVGEWVPEECSVS